MVACLLFAWVQLGETTAEFFGSADVARKEKQALLPAAASMDCD